MVPVPQSVRMESPCAARVSKESRLLSAMAMIDFEIVDRVLVNRACNTQCLHIPAPCKVVPIVGQDEHSRLLSLFNLTYLSPVDFIPTWRIAVEESGVIIPVFLTFKI